MDAAVSITSPPLLHVAVANEAWSFCLYSRLLASFLDDAYDLCYLSTCCRVFVPFRTQIWRIKYIDHKQPNLAEAISSGRLPCLCALDLDILDVNWKLEFPLLSLIIAGQIPALRELRLLFWHIEPDAVPAMLRLIALPRLERLHLRSCGGIHTKSINSIWDAAKKYPRLTICI